MALLNRVQKSARLDLSGIVRFQVALHCHFNGIVVTDADLDCLTLLAINGESGLSDFCQLASDQDIFSSAQSVRNALTKAEGKNLIQKSGRSRKKISLDPSMKIQTEGNILVEVKAVRTDGT